MHGYTAIYFVSFAQVGVCAACMMAFAGAFTTKQQFMHPHCIVFTNLDMLYKNDCWAAIPDPIWTINVPCERKINMLSSTGNNFMIFFVFLRDLGLNHDFLFFFNSYCVIPDLCILCMISNSPDDLDELYVCGSCVCVYK